MIKEDIDKIAETRPDAVLIGGEGERESYYPAIVAFDNEGGRFVYDYSLLVKAFEKTFSEGSEDPETDAVEWIDFNVVRSLPYYGDKAPFILYVDEDTGDVIDIGTNEAVDDRIATLYREVMKK